MKSALLSSLVLGFALSVTPVHANSLDNCGSRANPQQSPHCELQIELCFAYGFVTSVIANYSKHYSDNRDIEASLPAPIGSRPDDMELFNREIVVLHFVGDRLPDLIATIRISKYVDNLIQNSHPSAQVTVIDDCIAGTVDFLDNDGPLAPTCVADALGNPGAYRGDPAACLGNPTATQSTPWPAAPSTTDIRRAGLACQQFDSVSPMTRRAGDQAATTHVSCDNGRSTGWMVNVGGAWKLN